MSDILGFIEVITERERLDRELARIQRDVAGAARAKALRANRYAQRHGGVPPEPWRYAPGDLPYQSQADVELAIRLDTVQTLIELDEAQHRGRVILGTATTHIVSASVQDPEAHHLGPGQHYPAYHSAARAPADGFRGGSPPAALPPGR